MADLQTIAKAKAVSEVMKQVTGEQPTLEYHDDYVRIYFEPDRLKRVQKVIETMADKKIQSDVRIDWFPMFTPLAIKKAFPFAALIFSAGFLLGGKK